MGKTRLLQYAVESAPQMRCIWVTGVEVERSLAYAGLHRLLRPFLPSRENLPRPQRDALGSVFGTHDGAPADRFLVGLACLTLLADVATEGGLLCLIDDAQWLDQESLEALAFVGRRLSADRIALLLAVRQAEMAPEIFDDVPTLDITGLPEDAALELLATSVDVLVEADIARRIATETNGCPLALTELSKELTTDELRGGSLVSEPLPIGRRLERHYLRQVQSLPLPAQTFLLIASAETAGDLSLVRRAGEDLGAGPEAEDLAIASGLLTTEKGVAFRHSLVRSAVYASAPRTMRRHVHDTLARLIDRETDADRRAHHLAVAALGPDEDLARELELAAARAGNRGGYSAQTSFLLQSARLTPQAQERARRLLRASAAALASGSPHRAEALLAQGQSGLHEPMLQAEALRLDGLMRVPLGQPAAAPARLLAAAREFAPLDRQLGRATLLEALDAAAVSLRFTAGTTVEEIAEEALASPRPESAQATLMDYLLDGTATLIARGYENAVPLLRKAADIFSSGDVDREDIVKWFNLGCDITNDLWDDSAYVSWTRRVEGRARAEGGLLALRLGLVGLTKAEVRAGHFMAAEALYDEAIEVTRAMGDFVEFYSWLKADLHAWRGDVDGTRSMAGALREGGSAIGSDSACCFADAALATLALGEGNYAEALAAAQRLTDRTLIGWTSQGLYIAIEAAVRLGELDVAQRNLQTLRERAEATKSDWALGQLARSRALVAADDRTAEPFYQEAIDRLGETSVATELALAHLVYGEWLRRQKRRVDARHQLREAYDMLSSMGAGAFAERARRELSATGERVRSRSLPEVGDLTPQEAQVAHLAADGATNSEIASTMFISANTVDYHLRKVYRKLGISSRRSLGRVHQR
jgi:DNA-binding CsgD family transcriptional regulator